MYSLIKAVSQINQALNTRKIQVYIPYAKQSLLLIKLLYKEGLISSYSIREISNRNFALIEVCFKFHENKPVINNIKTIAKPGRFVYYKHKHLEKQLKHHNANIYILSNSFLGICTSKEAMRYNQGGLLLFEIN